MNKYFFTLVLIVAIGINTGCSQSSPEETDLLLIREDVVKPYLAPDYELALMDLAAFLKERGVKDVNYLTHIQDNCHYSHITTIKDFNEIDDGMEKFIGGLISNIEFDLIWKLMTETMESYHYYVVKYDKDNSYVPDGGNWIDGFPYRKWNYYYFNPGTEKEVDEILAAWKNLYERNGLATGYRVYRGLLGIEQPVVIFTSWAKTPLEHHQNLEANIEILGEEGSSLLLGMIELANRVETIEGYFVPEFSYQPKK